MCQILNQISHGKIAQVVYLSKKKEEKGKHNIVSRNAFLQNIMCLKTIVPVCLRKSYLHHG